MFISLYLCRCEWSDAKLKLAIVLVLLLQLLSWLVRNSSSKSLIIAEVDEVLWLFVLTENVVAPPSRVSTR